MKKRKKKSGFQRVALKVIVMIADMQIGATRISMGVFTAAVNMVAIISRVTEMDVFILRSELLSRNI